MSSSLDTLRFHFPTHGDSILSKINALRAERRFCDITLLLRDPQGATGQPLHFHGHKAVLAVSSDFLRDQFLLHEGRAELSVGVVSRAEVGKRLLLSCYTGLLEVPLRDVVSYLTAASALQMSQVVERCSQAISQHLGPTLALKPESHVEVKDSDQPGASSVHQEEKDAARPSVSVQEASTEEEGPVVSMSKSESEGGGDGQPANTNQPPYQVQHATVALGRDSPTAFEDHISPTTPCKATVCNIQNQGKEAEEGQSEEGQLFSLEAQPQECGEPPANHLHYIPRKHCLPKSCCPGDDQEECSDRVSMQRPYLCGRCDRVFQHLESYLGHLKQHRQCLCLVCGKGFSQRINLVRHIRAHTGVKPFRCPLCHKTFSQKATLQDHFSLHTGDEPHKCKYCGVLVQHTAGLRRHLKDIHGSGPQNMMEEAMH